MNSTALRAFWKLGLLLSLVLTFTIAMSDDDEISMMMDMTATMPMSEFDEDFQLTCESMGQFPYHATIRDGTPNEDHICGGIVIAPDLVLTAAQCVDPRNPRTTTTPALRIGGFTQKTPIEYRQAVSSVIHPDWNGNVLDGNDLAVLKLNETTCVTPIPFLGLADPNNRDVFFIGFGARSPNGPISNDLLGGPFMTLNNTFCNERFNLNPPLKAGQLCVQSPTDRAFTCNGDQGSPLIIQPTLTDFLDILVGISSYTTTFCGDPEGVSVFTDVAYYLPWIENITMNRFDGPLLEFSQFY